MTITHHDVLWSQFKLAMVSMELFKGPPLKRTCPGTNFPLEIELEVKPKLRPKRDPLLKNKKISREKHSAYFS